MDDYDFILRLYSLDGRKRVRRLGDTNNGVDPGGVVCRSPLDCTMFLFHNRLSELRQAERGETRSLRFSLLWNLLHGLSAV